LIDDLLLILILGVILVSAATYVAALVG